MSYAVPTGSLHFWRYFLYASHAHEGCKNVNNALMLNLHANVYWSLTKHTILRNTDALTQSRRATGVVKHRVE